MCYYDNSMLFGPRSPGDYYDDAHYIDGSVQDCSISIANTLEILQSFTKPWV